MTEQQFLVDFEPIGRRIQVIAGTDLLSAARHAGVDLLAVCGGLGICGSCIVRLVSGELTALTAEETDALAPEQIAKGFRLACQSVPLSDVRLEVPPESLPAGQRLQVEGRAGEAELRPAVIALDLHIPAADISTNMRADLSRVIDAINLTRGDSSDPLRVDDLETGLAALTQLSNALRENDWHIRLAIGSHHQAECNQNQPGRSGSQYWLAGTFPPSTDLLGLAVDMGSTKLAFYLVDLATGATLAQTGLMNPQIVYGEDVISRIAYANHSEQNRLLLQTRLIETINQAAESLCAEAGVSTGQIVDTVLVGNTAMHHFFSGLPVRQLGSAPYIPSVSTPLRFPAAETGLRFAPGARVYLPANIAGYVGADHTAALLSSGITDGQKSSVLVDIGTNTEISLVHGGKIYSCSTASGPAFEGAHIHDGMRAAPGAIDRVQIRADGVHVRTIQNAEGNVKPVGICGTGILQAVSEMLDASLLDERGMFNRHDSRIRIADKKTSFVLVDAPQSGSGREISVTRKDVNEIQLAKSAIRSGIDILLAVAGVQAEQIEQWVIAGAFGTYLDLGSAVRIGMLPAVPLERYEQVGNAAGMGARQMLLDARKRDEAACMAEGVEYIELTVYPGFTDVFLQNMYFPGC